MIKTLVDADTQFIKMISDARKDFAKGDLWEKDQTYQARIMIDWRMANDPNYLRFTVDRLLHYERDTIYQAVVNSGCEWTAIRSMFMARNSPEFIQRGLEWAFKVDAYAADQKVQVFIPVFDHSLMPRDVFKCTWCGGYTKNDKRGHCAGCGGPRDDSYLDELRNV